MEMEDRKKLSVEIWGRVHARRLEAMRFLDPGGSGNILGDRYVNMDNRSGYRRRRSVCSLLTNQPLGYLWYHKGGFSCIGFSSCSIIRRFSAPPFLAVYIYRESHVLRSRGVRNEEEWYPIHQNCMSVAISTLPSVAIHSVRPSSSNPLRGALYPPPSYKPRNLPPNSRIEFCCSFLATWFWTLREL